VYKVSNWLGYYIAKNMVTQTHRKWWRNGAPSGPTEMVGRNHLSFLWQVILWLCK
jgi:hypothetical protein